MHRAPGLPGLPGLPALLVLVAGLAALAAPSSAQPRAGAAGARPKNVVYFITDGFGPASVTFARDYVQATEGRRTLFFDRYLTGTVRTWATNSRVTDSAAGGTALATGHKSYNGAIAVDTAGAPVATILEGAERRGMRTGVVVTSRFTHATPACFTAHVGSRASEDEIAAQQIRSGADVMIGGGLRHFLPPDVAPGARRDGLNLLDSLRARGYAVALTKADYDRATRAPFAAFFAADHMAYEIDRDPAREPSLAEMTTKALAMLRGSPNGFFLMVEASRIDHAGHGNDAAAHLHDILAFEEAFRAAQAFAARDGATLVVSTSDHETGGLSLGRNVDGTGLYAWHPEAVARVRASHEAALPRLATAYGSDTTGTAALALVETTFGLADLSPAERAAMVGAFRARPAALPGLLTEAVGRRAIVGWTTNGHTAVDVNLYAFGPGADRLTGNMDNDEVGRAVADLMRLDLPRLTAELRARRPAAAGGGR